MTASDNRRDPARDSRMSSPAECGPVECESTRKLFEEYEGMQPRVEAEVCTGTGLPGSSSDFSGANEDFFLGPGAGGDPLIGQTLAGVHIEARIGTGGMGSVYVGLQLKTGKQVAVKVVRPEFGSRRVLERFNFEMQVLGKLEHPGLVQILHADTYTDAGSARPFFVVEYVPGGRRLDEYAAEHRPDERGWMRIFLAVAEEEGVLLAVPPISDCPQVLRKPPHQILTNPCSILCNEVPLSLVQLPQQVCKE